MYRYASSEIYDVTLTVKTPVFIGSGSNIGKKEFYVERDIIHVLDMNAVMNAVFRDGLVQDFQKLMIADVYKSTYDFLKSFFSADEIKRMTRYSCRCADVFSDGKPPADIQQFWHTPDDRPYIPGSSIKGAIRTCLIGAELLDEQAVLYDEEIKKGISTLEKKYTGIMRYISVSDSEPLSPTDLTLCRKHDVTPSGFAIPMDSVRECIIPGKKLKCKITIDNTNHVMSTERILRAIKQFSERYIKLTTDHYAFPNPCGVFTYDNHLILGGGCGYLSKTNVYEAAEYDVALAYVANFMKSKFRQGQHDNDQENGVSPHMLKYTKYGGQYYPFGICSLEFR